MNKHCDEYIDDATAPECLRRWLSYNRLAAALQRADLHGAPAEKIQAAKKYINPELRQFLWTDPEPILYATLDGDRVQCVAASRFGDIGVTLLNRGGSSDRRVLVSDLSDFSETPS